MAENSFNTVLAIRPSINKFNFNHSFTTPINIGELTPIEVRECVPGDKFTYNETHILKSAPMPSPIMNELDYYVHYFFVPFRLLTKDEMFATGDSLTDWRSPKLIRGQALDYGSVEQALFALDSSLTGVERGVSRLLAALGYGELDILYEDSEDPIYRPINSWAFDAYLKIYNDYYRNEFTQPEIPLVCDKELQDSVDESPLSAWLDYLTTLTDIHNFAHGNLLCRNFKKDLYTTLLPDPVLYGEQIQLTVQGLEKLTGDINFDTMSNTGEGSYGYINAISQNNPNSMFSFYVNKHGMNGPGYYVDGLPPTQEDPRQMLQKINVLFTGDSQQQAQIKGNFGVNKGIIRDAEINLSSAGNLNVGTINELRTAFKLQEFLERSITGGNRYIEQIWNHFGVKSSDARLQRPELIGYGHTPITISQINATNANADAQTLGAMAGHCVSFGNSEQFDYYCEEYGLIIGIASIMPANYYKITGMQKQFTRDNRLDYYWPSFAHIGMQEVRVHEFVGGSQVRDDVDLNEIVGYQDVYSDYKFAPSTVSRLMPEGLESWMWWNDFQTLADIECIPQDFDSIFSVSGTSEYDYQFILHSHQYIDAIREMPTFGTPML